jgi:hypothetical protein
MLPLTPEVELATPPILDISLAEPGKEHNGTHDSLPFQPGPDRLRWMTRYCKA